MIAKYINEERLFQILFEDVNFCNENLKQTLLNYINKYIQYKDISASELKNNYELFLKQYIKDTKYYLKNDQYPALVSGYTSNITREDYDVFLLLSTILTQHRFDIMSEINQHIITSDSALVIGSGIGLEIEIIKQSYINIDAYDIELDKFSHHIHDEVNFHETEFKSDNNRRYNDIYIIELLEHIHNPYALIKDAAEVMLEGGRIIVTLAVNVPQFDHVINFDNMNLFIERIEKLGLSIEYERKIKHKYLMNGLTQSSNIFLVLNRKR